MLSDLERNPPLSLAWIDLVASNQSVIKMSKLGSAHKPRFCYYTAFFCFQRRKDRERESLWTTGSSCHTLPALWKWRLKKKIWSCCKTTQCWASQQSAKPWSSSLCISCLKSFQITQSAITWTCQVPSGSSRLGGIAGALFSDFFGHVATISRMFLPFYCIGQPSFIKGPSFQQWVNALEF